MPGLLGVSDLELIARHRDKLVASDGTPIVLASGQRTVARTIVPDQKPDGSCVFLEQGRCSIHAYSPVGCRMFNACGEPTLVDLENRQQLYRGILDDQEASGDYSQAWVELEAAGRKASPVQERREAYRKSIIEAKKKQYKKRKSLR